MSLLSKCKFVYYTIILTRKRKVPIMKKSLLVLVSLVVLISSNLYAKQDNEHKNKNIPYGLQKKMDKDGTLPVGWQKKLKKGDILDDRMFKEAVEIRSREMKEIRNTKIYQLQDRIFRIANDTKKVIEILK